MNQNQKIVQILEKQNLIISMNDDDEIIESVNHMKKELKIVYKSCIMIRKTSYMYS